MEMWCYRTFIKAIIVTRSVLECTAIKGDSPVEVTIMVLESILSTASWKRSGKLGDMNLQD